MPLSQASAVDLTKLLLHTRTAEADYLDDIRAYWKGRQPLPLVPTGTPAEVRRLAQMSRVNIVELIIDVLGQSLYVDGYRAKEDKEQNSAWDYWQANKMDARQTGVHRSAFAYGTSYVLVLPGQLDGQPTPSIRGISPRYMTTLYGENPDWPDSGLEVICSNGKDMYRLYDDTAVYFLTESDQETKPGEEAADPLFLDVKTHDLGFAPIVRFQNEIDLDDDDPGLGEIDTIRPIQDQMDVTTFDLLVAQHFAAFRQRYVIGWTSPNETEKAKAAASHLWTFEDDEVKVGEFQQTQLDGYLGSRQAQVDLAGMLSQTPPHYLLGKLVNLAADALAAAESGQRRKIDERETIFGEAWEQVFAAATYIDTGLPPADDAQVVWRDTEARALASTIDALGKMHSMLGVPVEVLWERLPGFTQQDIEKAKAIVEETGSFAQLNAILDKQSTPAAPPEPSTFAPG